MEMEHPDFWNRGEEAQKLMKELKSLENDRDTCRNLEKTYADLQELIQM